MNILCYCDFACATGFSNVAENIILAYAKTLKRNDHIDIIGINYFGDIQELDANGFEVGEGKESIITLYSCYEKAKDKNDYYGRDSILYFCKEHKNYDILFIINDLQVISPMYSLLKLLKNQCYARNNEIKYIMYFPVDSQPHPWDVVAPDMFNPGKSAGIEIFDELITYTFYGKKCILEVIKKHSFTNFMKLSEKIKVIPHGANTTDFFPMDKNEKLIKFKREFFKCQDNDFIIGQVNRNSPRKDYPTSLQAFKIFLDRRKEQGLDTSHIKYYLHCNSMDQMGYDLFKIAAHLALSNENILLTPPGFNENQGVQAPTLNMIYNCLDLFLTTTTAEGWGLTIFEAMACMVPVIAPMHTSIEDIVNQRSLEMYEISLFNEVFLMADGEYIRYQSDPSKVADIIEWAYKDKECSSGVVSESVTKCYYEIKKMSWNKTTQNFISIFNQQKFKLSIVR